MAMRKNKRKMQALQFLKAGWGYPDTYNAGNVAYKLGISRKSASNLLRRLWKQGLVRRKKRDNGIEYWITRKGLERLKYLKRQRLKEKLRKLEFWRG